tara:strand:- start:458 stop:934 length:477 start_codon:yes stop_codon:yes gene_type:complete
MKLVSISSERDRIVSLFDLLDRESGKVDILAASTFGQFMAVKSGGFVETSVQQTMYEYAKRKSDTQIASYVLKQATYLNSLNCEKISKFLEPFNKDWWNEIAGHCPRTALESIDSLKNVRDDVAHGKHNGTGLRIVRGYFDDAVKFSTALQNVVLRGP